MNIPDYTLCIAPMMDWTDRHFRHFLRLITTEARLYTEMITTGALLNGNRRKLLEYHPIEHPIALQLGGCDPQEMAECAEMAVHEGYDEVNINVGCPSDRVQSGRFGACLMAEPSIVAACVEAMRERVDIPVTVKTRIGIDNQDSYDFLCEFIETVAEAGCDVFIVHARKAWLKGLSPKENREKPPLKYDVAARLKLDYPDLTIVLNGGIVSLDEAEQHLKTFDGVMIGREAYQNPYSLAEADSRLFGIDRDIPSRKQWLESYIPYIEEQIAQNVHLGSITRHLIGLFQSMPGARAWRRDMAEGSGRPGAGLHLIRAAAMRVQEPA